VAALGDDRHEEKGGPREAVGRVECGADRLTHEEALVQAGREGAGGGLVKDAVFGVADDVRDTVGEEHVCHDLGVRAREDNQLERRWKGGGNYKTVIRGGLRSLGGIVRGQIAGGGQCGGEVFLGDLHRRAYTITKDKRGGLISDCDS
jgi:hypothetical protein